MSRSTAFAAEISMASKAIVKCDRKWRILALAVLALTFWQGGPVSGRRRAGSDLPPLDRVQMGQPQRQAGDLWRRRPRGGGRRLPFHGTGEGRLQGLAGSGRGGLGHFTGLPPDRADPFQGQDGAGRRHVPPTPVAVLQEDADRPRLRHQAQCAGLHGLFGQIDRRLPENSTSSVPIMPWGASRCRSGTVCSHPF